MWLLNKLINILTITMLLFEKYLLKLLHINFTTSIELRTHVTRLKVEKDVPSLTINHISWCVKDVSVRRGGGEKAR